MEERADLGNESMSVEGVLEQARLHRVSKILPFDVIKDNKGTVANYKIIAFSTESVHRMTVCSGQ